MKLLIITKRGEGETPDEADAFEGAKVDWMTEPSGWLLILDKGQRIAGYPPGACLRVVVDDGR